MQNNTKGGKNLLLYNSELQILTIRIFYYYYYLFIIIIIINVEQNHWL